MVINQTNLPDVIAQELSRVKITDIHTHLFPAEFGELSLWGIDELLTYHYLVAEFFRFSSMPYDEFFALDRAAQADLIWQTLFIEHSPVSEAQRGVLTVLKALGLDVHSRNLDSYREYFRSMGQEAVISKVLELAGVEAVVMTNDPFDPIEHKLWQEGGTNDARFRAALRVDPLLNDFPKACSDLEAWGYKVEPSLNEQTVEEVKRFLREWLEKINGLYLAASLPCNFTMPDESIRGQLIEKCILPVCAALNVPFAMMIGTKRQVNPELRLAGDSLGKSDIKAMEYLCAKYPANKFLVTLLSRENQHELAITARKFRNLMVFGCWWFLNNPSIIEEITRMRVETLGLAFIPQHSDARVIEQLIYKWDHSKQIIGKVLLDKYTDLLETGWQLTQDEIARDISDLFGGNFWKFIEK